MDLHQILSDCCFEFRKGPQTTTTVIGRIQKLDIYLMPHINDAPGNLEQVDVHFMFVGVDREKAESHRADLITILEPHRPLLERGPSYMTIAQEFEIEQDRAFHLMAVGQVLGFWGVMTPEVFSLTGDMADRAAGAGYIMINGYRTEEKAA